MKIAPRARIRAIASTFAVLQLTAMAGNARAEEDVDGCRERRHRPVAEAFDACEDAQEGESCSFTGRRERVLTGTCEFRREHFLCVPERRERGPRGEREAQES